MSVLVQPPYDRSYERNHIFASNFIYFIAREYGTNWEPNYTYIDRSCPPLTSDIKDGARAFLRNREHIFAEHYEALVPPGMLAHVGIFSGHAMQAFHIFYARCGTPVVFFYLMVYVSRLGILFYQRGVREAPDHAAAIIATFLWHFMQIVGPEVFSMFEVIGRDLARLP